MNGGGWHDAWTDCCLKLAATIGLWPLALVPSLTPFLLIALLPPSALTPLVWSILTSLRTLPVPWHGVPMEPLDGAGGRGVGGGGVYGFFSRTFRT